MRQIGLGFYLDLLAKIGLQLISLETLRKYLVSSSHGKINPIDLQGVLSLFEGH